MIPFRNGFVSFIILGCFTIGSFVYISLQKFRSNTNPAPVVLNLGLNLNPNIGTDGKNKSILGKCGTVFASLLMMVVLLPFFLTEIFETKFEPEWHKLYFLLPNIVPTFLIPALFYVTNPKSFLIIKDLIYDLF